MTRQMDKIKPAQKKVHSQRKEQPDTRTVTIRIPTDKYNKLKAAGGTFRHYLEKAVIETIDLIEPTKRTK